jgi:hypothetical protein
VAAVDVVMPAHEKDFGTLRAAVRSVLRHVTPIRRVLVVAASPFEHGDERVAWVAEPAPPQLPTLDEVRERWAQESPETVSRASWVYQQLLKLGADRYIEDLTPSYLVVDSDLVFVRPVSFDPDTLGRFPYSRAVEFHPPYREAYERLLGTPPPTGFSLTAHHMLYDRIWVAELREEIEQRHGKPWCDAYLDCVDKSALSSISEMDIYGWWMLERHPEAARDRQLFWCDVAGAPGPLQRAAFAANFDFVAAHAWARQPRLLRHVAGAARVVAELRAVLPKPFAG